MWFRGGAEEEKLDNILGVRCTVMRRWFSSDALVSDDGNNHDDEKATATTSNNKYASKQQQLLATATNQASALYNDIKLNLRWQVKNYIGNLKVTFTSQIGFEIL